MIRGIVYDPPTFGFPILVVVLDGDMVLAVETAQSLPLAEARLAALLRFRQQPAVETSVAVVPFG
jgi:hypothetical protein